MKTFSFKSLFLILITGLLLACVKEEPEKSDSTTSPKQYTRAYGDKSPKVIAIIETNDTDPRNVLSYHWGLRRTGLCFLILSSFLPQIFTGTQTTIRQSISILSWPL